MKDDVLNDYVKKLLSKNIEEDKFREYIDMYSKFLGYVNPAYKYNGTYLSQYVDDFKDVYQKLKEKKEKYIKIYISLTTVLQSFELVIDRVFYVAHDFFSKDEMGYIGIDKDRIVSDFFEVHIIINQKNKLCTFCKEYQNFENGLLENVCNDIEKFLDIQKGEDNDIA